MSALHMCVVVAALPPFLSWPPSPFIHPTTLSSLLTFFGRVVAFLPSLAYSRIPIRDHELREREGGRLRGGNGQSTYREAKKGLYVVALNFFLLLLNCSAWPCLGPA